MTEVQDNLTTEERKILRDSHEPAGARYCVSGPKRRSELAADSMDAPIAYAAFTKKLRPHRDRRVPKWRQGSRGAFPDRLAGCKMNEQTRGPRKIGFFGHFDGTNFGNECTLLATLYHLHRIQPETHVTCICTGPQTTASTYHIEAVPITRVFLKTWIPRSPLTRVARKICVALRESLFNGLKVSGLFGVLKCL